MTEGPLAVSALHADAAELELSELSELSHVAVDDVDSLATVSLVELSPDAVGLDCCVELESTEADALLLLDGAQELSSVDALGSVDDSVALDSGEVPVDVDGIDSSEVVELDSGDPEVVNDELDPGVPVELDSSELRVGVDELEAARDEVDSLVVLVRAEALDWLWTVDALVSTEPEEVPSSVVLPLRVALADGELADTLPREVIFAALE